MTRILTLILSAGLMILTAQTASARDDGGFGETGMTSESYTAFEDPATTIDPSSIEPAAGEEEEQASPEAENQEEQASPEDAQQ